MTYLDRLRALKSEKGPPPHTDKTDKTSTGVGYVSFDGARGTPLSEISSPLRRTLAESERRSPILDGAGLRHILVFRKRLSMMHRDGWKGRKANSGMAFAWFVWERGYRGHPIMQRISWDDERDAGPVLLPHGRPIKGSRSGSQIKRGANRAYVLARLRRDGRTDLIAMVESGELSARRALAAIVCKQVCEQVGQ
jgi:hypothetical protein